MSGTKKIAVVTGASRGIGRAIALKLAKEGIKVAVNYNGSEDKAKEVLSEIIASGGEGIIVKANISNAEDVAKMFETVENELGKVDILVNNAGITKDNLIMRMKEEEWDSVIETNLKGAFNCIKAISRGMIKQKAGKIINIASVVALAGNVGQSNYVAAKAGIIGLTKSVALEFASRGIQVNAVAPGFISTDMTDALPDNIKEQLLERIPVKKLGTPEDVANTVAFLASPESDYITGQVINVNGGMYV
ncbi:3-oxoacyl-[acyl-carrier-protein] reductase [Desulfonispora thiosulfatigenes DSM 11270]|uniref:3-oxoacyl-[acyl-carrier-protein] reductase n=1 Tax=Desulfonispora thiosulfatigenes DSM 11270 TaxID=656914 RepID=A0A1W1VKY1_DESTI|nr:3-oxoacyl-[acyl-carrier-protein] reductase [Desulfonispora thiosulfatigenes]SMB93624.1 3-oxoacyl-[acyl-carrier-protein] reductase [Desulfonispora thiosulfatigenes DSM 11270]